MAYCVVVAVLVAAVSPYALTVAMMPLMLASTANGCSAVSMGANGVGMGGSGYAVMSFNIRGAQLPASTAGMSKHKGDYAWSTRGPVAAQYVAAVNPDLIGIQENGTIPGSGKRQLTTIRERLSGYRWLYADMPIPIGYRESAFTLVDHGRVQLNWKGKGGATGNRWAVWAKLTTSTGNQVLFINLHSQYMQLKAQAKARSAGWTRLINTLDKKIDPGRKLPTIMAGDFNAGSDETRAIFRDHLVKLGAAGFVDASATGTRIAPVAGVSSFSGFGDTIKGKWYYKAINRTSSGAHIDYVWTRGKATASTWQIYTGPTVAWKTIKGEQVPFASFIPSDHWPVIARVAVGTAAAAPAGTTASRPGDVDMVLSQRSATSTGVGSLPQPGQPRHQSLTSPAIDIPARIKALYVAAATRYAIPWQLLAGIGMAETRHGNNNNTSSAGAQGLMQFMPRTFAGFGVDGDGDGVKDIHSDADSIYSAANYLVASGARQGSQGVIKALWAYNRSESYRNDVLYYARSYSAAGDGALTTAPAGCDGMMSEFTQLDPTASGEWADVINFALSKVGVYPYSWGGGTLTGPSRGTEGGANIVGFDCSSFTRFVVYQKTGVVLPRTSRGQAKFLQQRGVVTRTNDWRDLKSGDIVFYSRGSTLGSIYHVGIVTKPGWIVEEPGAGRRVQHNQLERRMPRDIWGYARVGLSSLKQTT